MFKNVSHACYCEMHKSQNSIKPAPTGPVGGGCAEGGEATGSQPSPGRQEHAGSDSLRGRSLSGEGWSLEQSQG